MFKKTVRERSRNVIDYGIIYFWHTQVMQYFERIEYILNTRT